jgi:pimeloyl-ACP methyl ester carboxylesterase
MGWSDRGPEVITAGMLAEDLERLTKSAGLQGPFVLVLASIGGITVEMFARRYSKQVAGLVFVDAAIGVRAAFGCACWVATVG